MASLEEEERLLRNAPTYEEQAAQELNFVGDAWYYDLSQYKVSLSITKSAIKRSEAL
jgi:hypothetical protein